MKRQIPSWYGLLTILAVVLSATGVLPASAGGIAINDEPSIAVKLDDLDLNTESGSRAALDRLSKAAYRVCDQQATSFASLGYPQVLRVCHDGTLAAVVKKIHHKQLSALFVARSHPRAG